VTDFAVMGLSTRRADGARGAGPRTSRPDEMYRRLLRSLDMAAELGITTAVEPQNSLDDLSVCSRRRATRARCARGSSRRCSTRRRTTSEELDAFADAKGRTTTTGSGWADQALHRRRDRAAHARRCSAPYANRPDTSGARSTRRTVRRAHRGARASRLPDLHPRHR
jgi:hypothetical protein